ncbi:MAG: undecaprenyl/decaprenyl-phosphate alpha-N-acetylglucosaminyl 1-phosphate transferase [Alphaproteobacteria bacterium]|nr:undecaprenyl/decaprenyl-phosphate alpha-N-acetylglucosaminyl 1-phosphate transferase [Alphaproteobacteria bacterium]
MTILISYCAAVAVTAAVVTYAVARLRLFLDEPNTRSSHKIAVPRSGGLGIVIASVLGVTVLATLGHPALFRDPTFLGVIGGGLIAAAAGLADDMRARSFRFKLAAQVAAAAAAMASGLVVDRLYVPGIGPVDLGLAGPVLTFVWMIGLTNAYNFMDGIDGLAGGTAVIAGAFLAFAAVAVGAANEGTIACTIAMASLGFLVFNLPPARIFMGDVGSQFLGFVFASLGVLVARTDASGTLALLTPLLLFHFIFDTLVTAGRRWWRGEKVTQGHRSHLYQRLAHSGFGHGRTTAILCAIGAAQGAGALWMVHARPELRPLVFVPALLVQLIYMLAVQRREAASAAAE